MNNIVSTMLNQSDIRVIGHLESGLVSPANGTFTGLFVQVLAELSVATDLSFRITKAVDYGDIRIYGSGKDIFGTDLISALSSGDVDLACCAYYYISKRAKQARILLPLFTEKFRGFFVQPGLNDRPSNIFYAPFGTTAAIFYYTLIAVFVVAAFFINWRSDISKSYKEATKSFLRGSWWILIAYSLKNYSMPSRPVSLQVMAMTTSLFFYIINSMYSAYLLSILTSAVNPIRNFDDLINYGYSFYANPSITEMMGSHKMYKMKSESEMKGSLNSFRLAAKGGHVHVDHADSFAYYAKAMGFTKEDICKKVFLVPFSTKVSSGIYLKRNSSQELRESLNRGIAKLGDSGLLNKLSKEYFRGLMTSCSVRLNGHIEMEVNHVGRLFEVFGIMLGLTVLFFGVEKATKDKT